MDRPVFAFLEGDHGPAPFFSAEGASCPRRSSGKENGHCGSRWSSAFWRWIPSSDGTTRRSWRPGFAALPGFAAARSVLLYVTAFPEEIATGPLLVQTLDHGKCLVCPRVDRAEAGSGSFGSTTRRGTSNPVLGVSPSRGGLPRGCSRSHRLGARPRPGFRSRKATAWAAAPAITTACSRHSAPTHDAGP